MSRIVTVVDELPLLRLRKLCVLPAVSGQHTEPHRNGGDHVLNLPQVRQDSLRAALVEITQAISSLEKEQRAVIIEEVPKEVLGLAHELLYLAIILRLESDQLGDNGSLGFQFFEVDFFLSFLCRVVRVLCLSVFSAALFSALHQIFQEFFIVHAHSFEEDLDVMGLFKDH